MENISELLNGISHIVFGVVTLATIIVRLTPTKSDDKKLDAALKKTHKFMAYLPTVGKNPRTKELERESPEKKEEPNAPGK